MKKEVETQMRKQQGAQKRNALTKTSIFNMYEQDVDFVMQIKIENMITFKKAKDRMQMLNNPPQKETNLKGSKDTVESEAFSNHFYKPGVFGPVDKTQGAKGNATLNQLDQMIS